MKAPKTMTINEPEAAPAPVPKFEVKVNVDTAADLPTPEVAVPSAADIAQILKLLSDQANEIKELKARVPQAVTNEDDLTDTYLFIARPNGEPWEERIVVDGKTKLIEGRRTAFYGPFDTQEQIDEYLEAKRNKRQDGSIDWQTVYTIVGKEARRLRWSEKQDIKKQFGGSPAVNILDRRMRPALDVMTGAMDRKPGIGVAIAPADFA